MRGAAPRPDGTFEYDGQIYRLEDAERDHFVVRRLSDTLVERAPVAAIARLLGEIRGVVPLQ